MTVKIIVASHKPYEMPSDPMYLPLHVGAAGKESIGYERDDSGENISDLNPYYCELTGLYWAWKQLKEDYIGLVHYRRLFAVKGQTLSEKQLEPFLGRIRLFVPKKRRYYIESLKTHYDHTHMPDHLTVTEEVLNEKYPSYAASYQKVMKRTWGYMFNMMIMQRELLDDYCSWLFDILFEVFKRIDTSSYDAFEKRYVGRVSELLFNVWLDKAYADGKIEKKEIMELDCNIRENLLVKIPAFLKAKFFGKRYKGSF